MFEKIQKWYKQKLWTYTMVQNALEKGVITPEQFAEITKEDSNGLDKH